MGFQKLLLKRLANLLSRTDVDNGFEADAGKPVDFGDGFRNHDLAQGRTENLVSGPQRHREQVFSAGRRDIRRRRPKLTPPQSLLCFAILHISELGSGEHYGAHSSCQRLAAALDEREVRPQQGRRAAELLLLRLRTRIPREMVNMIDISP